MKKLLLVWMSVNAFCLVAKGDFPEALRRLECNDPTLVELSFRGQRIEQQNVEMLANALLYNTSLISLDLTGCVMGYEGAIAIMQTLSTNTALRHLDLSSNFIICDSEAQATALLEPLKSNSTLNELILETNMLGRFCVPEVISIWQNNQGLTDFNLKRNFIGNEGVNQITRLPEFTNRPGLSLSENNISLELMEVIHLTP